MQAFPLRRVTGHGAQNRVLSALQRLPSLREQRGEVDPPDPRKVAQDRDAFRWPGQIQFACNA
jgi:hypothetical protein